MVDVNAWELEGGEMRKWDGWGSVVMRTGSE